MFTNRIQSFDSLRALAITAVVFGHLFGLRGGFIGVDVFFVISGYVITLSLLSDHERGQLSIGRFYRNRIARIIPPLLASTLLAYILAQYVLVDELDYEAFKTSYFYQAFFLQNYYFLQSDSNYFQAIAEAKFNTHLWSISIEEQFYLIYPLTFFAVLAVVKRKSIQVGGWLSIAASFVLFLLLGDLVYKLFLADGWFTTINIQSYPRYYIIQNRAWELLVGCASCLIAGELMWRGAKPSRGIKIAALTILPVVLFGSFISLGSAPAWPRIESIIPILATALLMIVLHLTFDEPTIFDNKIIRSVGRSSYSIYLLHWPLFAALLYLNSDFLKFKSDYVIYFAALAGLSTLSYQFIEKRRKKVSLAALACIVLGFLSLQLAVCMSYPRRLNVPASILNNINETSKIVKSCEGCETTDNFAGDFILLWGDSHAQIYATEVVSYAHEHNLKVAFVICPPVTNACINGENYRRALALSKKPGFKFLIMGGRWSAYLTGGEMAESDKGDENFKSGLQKFATDFADTKIIFLSEAPSFATPPRKEALLEFLPFRLRRLSLPPKPLAEHKAEKLKAALLMKPIIQSFKTHKLVDPADTLCAGSQCDWRDQDYHLYYFDRDHLSVFGAKTVFPAIVRAIEQLK